MTNSPETSSTTTTTTTAKKSKAKADELQQEAPEWLPEGWVMELKYAAAAAGTTTTKMVKLFVAPSGQKFYSKPQVLRHVHTSSSKHQTTDNSRVSADLPPGWVSKLNTKGGRRDWYFTDPLSGFIFRSRKDVFRYLQTGDVTMCATRPRIENDSRASSKTVATDTPTTQTPQSSSIAPPLLTHEATTKRFTRGSAHVLSSANKTPSKLAAKGRLELRNLMSPNSIEVDTSTRRVTRGYSKQVSPSTKHLPMDHVAASTPNSDGASIKIGGGSAKTNGIDIQLNGVDPPEDSTMKGFTRGSSKTNIESSKDDSPNFKDAGIKRVTRGSAKTNGIDIEVGVNFDPICSVVSPVKDSKRKHGKMVDAAQYSPSPVKDPNTKVAKKDSTQNGTNQRITRKNQPNAEDLKRQEEMNATRRSSRRHAAIASKPLVNINSEAQKQTPQAIAREENVDAIVALNMIVDSVAQWASQQLASIPELASKSSPAVPDDINNVEPSDKTTTIIPCENQTDPKLFGCLDDGNQTETRVEYLQPEKNGNQPSFVFGDSWADPCLEFAYKTLTSDLPMENNQNYFQPQPYCVETTMVIDDGLVLRIPKNTFDSTTTTSDVPVTPVFGQRSRAFIPSIDVNIPFNPQESSFDERNKNHKREI